MGEIDRFGLSDLLTRGRGGGGGEGGGWWGWGGWGWEGGRGREDAGHMKRCDCVWRLYVRMFEVWLSRKDTVRC